MTNEKNDDARVAGCQLCKGAGLIGGQGDMQRCPQCSEPGSASNVARQGDTPRCDAEEVKIALSDPTANPNASIAAFVPAKLGRELERELAEARSIAACIYKAMVHAAPDVGTSDDARVGREQGNPFGWGRLCEVCKEPVYVPTSRHQPGAMSLGDRIWHGWCFPPGGAYEHVTVQAGTSNVTVCGTAVAMEAARAVESNGRIPESACYRTDWEACHDERCQTRCRFAAPVEQPVVQQHREPEDIIATMEADEALMRRFPLEGPAVFLKEIRRLRALVGGGAPKMSRHGWLILFDDAEVGPEIYWGDSTAEEAARESFKRLSASWNAHLFRLVESNTRDATMDVQSEGRQHG